MPRARWKTNAARHQPEHRARRADRDGVRRQQQRAERAGQQRGEVERDEAHVPERRLEHRPEPVEDVHVEARCAAGPACRKPPVISRQYSPSATPIGCPSGPPANPTVPRSMNTVLAAAARRERADVEQHADPDQHVRHGRLARRRCASCGPASSAASTPGSACRPASPSCSRGRSGCRSSSTRRPSRGRGGGSRRPSRRLKLAAVLGSQDKLSGRRSAARRSARREPPCGSSVTSTCSTPSSRAGIAAVRRAVAARHEQRVRRLRGLGPSRMSHTCRRGPRAGRAGSCATSVAWSPVDVELGAGARRGRRSRTTVRVVAARSSATPASTPATRSAAATGARPPAAEPRPRPAALGALGGRSALGARRRRAARPRARPRP